MTTRESSRPNAWPYLSVAAAVIVAVGAVAASRPDGWTRVTVLDVGQGDAILIEGSSGGRVLVDGGPDGDRLRAVLDARIPAWDRRIDLVILTHPHEDHAAGMVGLVGRYRIGRFFEPGMRGPGPGYVALAGSLDRQEIRRERLFTGDRFGVDDADVRVLWPDRGSVPDAPPDDGKGINNVSIVLDVKVGARRFLLMGDVEETVDPVLLARGVPHADVLKVAHHGSGTASSGAFLAAVSPRIAAVSVGARNRYGHPAAATIDRLTAVADRVFRTDRDGSVTIATDGAALSVSANRDTAGSQPALVTVARPRAPTRRPPATTASDPVRSRTRARARVRSGRWRSPDASRPRLSCSGSTRRAGTFATARASPRSPPISPPAPRARAAASTAR
jgi:competence protein ComEC